MKMLDLRRDEWEALTKEERSQHRKRAKAVNFGRLFGQGAEGLVKAAREQYGVIIDLVTAKAWIETFKRTYPDYTRWCSRFANACQRSGEIPIGRDGGRVHETGTTTRQGSLSLLMSAPSPLRGASDALDTR